MSDFGCYVWTRPVSVNFCCEYFRISSTTSSSTTLTLRRQGPAKIPPFIAAWADRDGMLADPEIGCLVR